jgi:hypothetical protein
LPRGSQPGERRGGRQKGTPNRRTTILRDLAIDGNRQLAVDHMAEVLEFYTERAINDPEQVEHWQRCRLEAATRLAKYQSPQLQARMRTLFTYSPSASHEPNRPLAILLMILLVGITAAAVFKQLMH